MAGLPSYDLGLRAAGERERLHDSVAEFRSRVRQELDPKKQIRENLGVACGVAAAVGLFLGFSAAGLFMRDKSFLEVPRPVSRTRGAVKRARKM